jgi:hypothetical protein
MGARAPEFSMEAAKFLEKNPGSFPFILDAWMR